MPETGRATAIGATAIVMWSSLALLTSLAGGVPPFQLTAMAFTVAVLVGVPVARRRGLRGRDLARIPRGAWINGAWGLFGYHAFYFVALKNAPLVEANLVNYLWPLLFILFTTFLPGESLRWRHGLGTLAGFLGAALLVSGGRGFGFDAAHLPGYASALGAAVCWASYSVISRRYEGVPSTAIGAFCAVTAVLAWAVHLVFETPAWHRGGQWLVVVLMGLGPLGLAFFVWDHGVKKGRIATLAALSYFAPLFSTLLLVAAGQAEAGWAVGAACVLITGGAVLASGWGRR